MNAQNEKLGESYAPIREAELYGQSGTLVICQTVAAAETSEGEEFYCMHNMGSHAPVIESKKTGRQFLLSWEEIINLAIWSGILDMSVIPDSVKKKETVRCHTCSSEIKLSTDKFTREKLDKYEAFVFLCHTCTVEKAVAAIKAGD